MENRRTTEGNFDKNLKPIVFNELPYNIRSELQDFNMIDDKRYNVASFMLKGC